MRFVLDTSIDRCGKVVFLEDYDGNGAQFYPRTVGISALPPLGQLLVLRASS